MTGVEWMNFQTGAPLDMIKALKVHAAERGVLLSDLYLEAAEHFFKHRETLRAHRQYVPYLFQRPREKPFTIRLPVKHGRKIEAIAVEDEVPLRRVIYTMLINYTATKQLIKSVGTIESGKVNMADPEMKAILDDYQAKRKRK